MSDNPFSSNLLDKSETKPSLLEEDSNTLSLNNISDLSKNDNSASLTYSTKTVEETITALSTDGKNGLSDLNDIKSRQDEYGENECKSDDDDEPLIIQFLKTFTEDPLILLLIASAVVSFLMGNTDDAVSITMAIVIVVTVGFVQEYRSEKTLEALNELVPMECHLIRNGNSNANILASTLVPGDLVVLRTGDKVPADIRIIESVNLNINESSLTGETTPVLKNCYPVKSMGDTIPIAERSNIAFMGTLVTDGSAKGIVVGTGKNTMFGKVFEMMNAIKKPKTPLQQAMDKLGKDLSYFSFILIGVICLIGVIQGRSWLTMFQISVSLAVAAIPEGLPIIVTVTLALGVLRMANKKAIVKRLPSVETLGSVNVICSDKTGTLTMNMMKVTKLWTLGSMENENHIMDIENKKQTHGIYNDFIKTLNNSDTMDKKKFCDIYKLLECGNFCNTAIYSNEQYKYIGNPTEIAIMDLLKEFGLQDKRNDLKYEKKYELPFNSSRKYMAVSLKNDDLYVKGALEKVLSNSKYYMSSAGKREKLTTELKAKIQNTEKTLALEGLRIIAAATGNLNKNDTLKSDDDVNDLTFLGLIGMKDPPRPHVAESIEHLLEGQVHIIMITGDSPTTALSIAGQIGIPLDLANPENNMITGDKLDHMNEDQLADVIDRVNVFARATPNHKLMIVKALQKRGDVVGMTGDGVNDAPALKLADIGIAMGKNGTDVAKEASDMVLVDDDFSTILSAIEEGKGIFNNIQNFITFQLSTSVAALSLVLLSTLFNLPTPLNAMQILWINILMDGPPAQSLGVEPVGHEVMKKPPRKRDEKILTYKLFKRVLQSAICIIIGTLFIFVKEMVDGEITKRDTTMTFTCFVFFDMFNAVACRHTTKSIFEVGFFNNKMFNYAVGLSLLGQMCAIYLPFAQSIFNTEALSLYDLLFLLMISSSVFIADEVRKHYSKEKELLSQGVFSQV
ncbi:High affinity Ca2+/Mn2+ P-type ATPase-like protein [Hanseniaspora guilliermondii]